MTINLFVYEGKNIHTGKLLPPVCTGSRLKTDEPFTSEKIKPVGSENLLSSSELA